MNSSPESWNDRALAELMDHIVGKHHAFCRQGVERLGTLFREAIAKHGKDHPELRKMEALFARMARDLQMHLLKEEQTLFPYIARVEEAIKQSAPVSWPPFGTVGNPIRMMVLEHEQTDEELKEIRRLSNDYAAPPDAPEALADLFSELRAFDLDMSEHVHAEDHLLFPRAIAMETEACARPKPPSPGP